MARGRRSTPSRSTPSRASKLSASTASSSKSNNYVLPKSRTWIYTTSPPDDDLLSSSSNLGLGNGSGGSITSDGYELYLGTRVQRPVVRSLPPSYSYFKDKEVGVSNLGGLPESAVKFSAAASGGEGAVDGGEAMDVDDNAAAAALKSEEGTPANSNDYDGINEIQPHNVNYTYIPLPAEKPIATTSSLEQSQKPTSTTVSSLSYSKFTQPTHIKDSRHQKFQFSLNYNTHLPNKNVISWVGTNAEIKNKGESGYVCQLPLVGGTVLAYSPSLVNCGMMEDYGGNYAGGGDVDLLYSSEGAAVSYNQVAENGSGGDGNSKYIAINQVEEAEFPTSRMTDDVVLFRVLWDGYSTSTTTTDGTSSDEKMKMTSGYIEDITLPELLSCLINPPSSLTNTQRLTHQKTLVTPYNLSSMPTSTTDLTVIPQKLLKLTSQSITKHVHATTCRKQFGLEWRIENDILCNLVTCAALEIRKEIGLKIRYELLVERTRLRVEGGLEKKKKKKKMKGDSDEEVVNEDGNDFGYYYKHPNQYMSSFTPPPALPSDDDDDDSDEDGEGITNKKRSKTKLSKDELKQYQIKLSEQVNIAPSKIAERIKVACTMAYDYVQQTGKLVDYYNECDKRKIAEGKEKERMASIVGGRGMGSGRQNIAPPTDGGEVRRSSRARTTVDYTDAGMMMASAGGGGIGIDELDDAMEMKVSSKSLLPRENVVGGPTALYLLNMLDMMPKEEKEEDDEADGDEDMKDDDDDNDPFFKPNSCLIIDQLGRKHRYLSPSSIQQSIVRSIEAHQITTPKYLLDEEELNDGHSHVTDLICTTGDKISDLGQFEPSSFARCRFAPHTFIPETDEEHDHDDHNDHEEEDTPEEIEARRLAEEASKQRKIQRRLDKKAAIQKRNAELERAYRARKAFEIWRFRSIHGDGCTIFPTWREFSMKILKDKFSSSKVGGSASGVGDAASSQAASTNGMKTSPPHPADAWGKTITVSDSSRPAAASSNVVTSSSEAAVSSTAAPPVPPAQAATAVPSSTQNDEELARSLAAAAETNGDDLPLAKRRRTTRRAATSGSEPVFYGGHTSFSRDQLLDSLVRILHQTKPGSSSLMDLKKLVFPEIVDTSRGGAPEMKKIRSALGHLVYRLGKVSRLIVDVEKGDATCLELLKEGPLVKFQTDNVDANDEVGGDAAAAAKSAPSQPKSEETVSRSTEDQPMEAVKTDDPIANNGGDSTETTDAAANVNSATAEAALAPRTYDKQGRPEWREDDDELLWLCHQEMGNKWAEMTELHFKERGLMENHVKNRWYSVTFKRFVATKYGPDAHPNSLSASAPVMDEHTKARLSALEGYISNLHHTELSLRKSLMKVIDKGYGNKDSNGTLLQISTTAIATAADEVDGMAGAEDWKHFANGSGEEVKWNSTSRAHELIGQVLFRPQSSPLRPKPDENAPNNDDSTTLVNSKCHWYRIVSYTPSIKAVEDVTSTNGVGDNPSSAADIAKKDAPQENLIVERRMRFRAVPVAESDIDAMNHRMDIDNDDDDVEYMLLTEGQARAGIEAALLHRTIENKAKKGGASSETLSQATVPPAGPHPFRHRYGSRVTLTPKSKDGEDVQGKDILYGIVAGFDIIQDDDGVTKNKLLVLLEEEEEEVKPQEEDTAQVEKEEKARVAFWSTVEGTEGATSISDIVPAAGSSQDRSWTASSLLSYSTYDIDTNEYHQGSEAYDTCLSILTYMKNNNRSVPFLVPVDPVAHSAPGYFDVIKEPMDLSTLEKYLENGKCSKIEYVFENEGDEGITTPVYRMVYGPFFHYMSLIFDNCVEYNGVDSWIANEAKYLKNLFEKKCNQLVKKAVGASSKSAGRPSRGAQKSMYSEVDSDVDMYQYDSEYDDDEYDGGRRSRKGKKRRKNAAKKKEDIPSKAIEQPFMVPENAFEFGGGLGSFPHLKVQTNVGKFTFSQDWSCRYMKETKEDDSAEDGKVPTKEESEEAEMLMLMQMQQQENEAATVRRSTRDRHAPTNYADEEVYGVPAVSSTPQAPVTLPGVEYYLMNDDVLQPKKSSTDDKEDSSNAFADSSIIPTTCRSRLGAEGIQETIHEQIYAKAYHDHSHNALVLDNGLGQYAEGSFPPYLGRVVPAVSSSSVDGIVWEIREQYLIPALRWVLRGLVRSGHLAEVDGSLSEGMMEDATTRTSFGSGIVVPSHEYYCNETSTPFDVLDEKEILRKRRQDAATGGDSSSEEEVELSEYEQMRAQRVARNAERLRALGLA